MTDGKPTSESRSASEGKRKRILTPFLCHEMLYDYSLGLLDAERKAAVEECLLTDAESQRLLKAIREGQNYIEKLALSDVRTSILSELHDAENVMSLGRRYSSWRAWPDTLRWSVLALVTSASVAAIISNMPWHRISGFLNFKPKNTDNVELVQIATNSESTNQLGNEQPEAPSSASTEDGEEVPIEVAGSGSAAGLGAAARGESKDAPGGASADASAHKGQVIAAETKLKSAPTSPEGNKGHLDSVPTASQQSPKIPASKDASKDVATVTLAEESQAESQPTSLSEKKEVKAKGFVYRAFMNLPDLAVVAPKVADEIRQLGGEKAGEVDLGWKRGAGHYYHFSLPQVNEEKLLERLRAYGPVRISKDPHPRVMPEGRVRFILWIEST
jgi:hypothetical protein